MLLLSYHRERNVAWYQHVRRTTNVYPHVSRRRERVEHSLLLLYICLVLTAPQKSQRGLLAAVS